MTRMLLLAALAAPAVAADPTWPQFRGPNGSGVAAGQTPPTRFGPQTNVKWKVEAPGGTSSPVIVGDRVFLTGFDAGKLLTLAYDRATGAEVWRREAPATAIEPHHKTENSPASASVASDGERVISYFGSCGLFAYDLDGKELWKYELPTAVTGFDFGSGVSPVVADGLVVLARDLKTDSTLLAIDAKTGSRKWETKRPLFPTGWSTPAVWDTPSGKQVVLPGYGRMVAYDLATGTEAWSVAGMPSACCTTPVVADGLLLFAGWSPTGDDMKLPGFGKLIEGADANGDGVLSKDESEKTMIAGFFDGNDLNKDGKITREEWEMTVKEMAKYASGKNSAFAVKAGGRGDVSATHVVWRNTKAKLLPYVPSAIAYDGTYYMVKDGGLMSAFEAKTGKELYAEERAAAPGQYYASPVAANGHLYLIALNGDVTVLKAGEVPTAVFRGKLNERTAATPAVAGHTLYVRTAKHLYAFAEGK